MKIIECPRDAMQGLHEYIPVEDKVRYINKLLDVGFDTIDFGSFVSPKAIPQLRDTAEVLTKLNLPKSKSDLLAIVANLRGALQASQYDEIKYLGYPFSISETFQRRNTNASIAESLDLVKDIQEICTQRNKELVIYISMGFGNPYGDDWNVDIVVQWVNKLQALGINIFQLSDTVGVASPDSISYLFKYLIPEYPNSEIGAHFHTTPDSWREKISAAYKNGCQRFDGAISGVGGCPMAQNELVGNMPTENLLQFAKDESIELNLNMDAFAEAIQICQEIMF